MTVSITTRRNDYTGNGAVDEYAFSFHINASSELRVTIRDTDGVEELQVLTTDYTVDGVDDVSGGTITLVAGNLTNGYHLTIQGIDPLTQTTDIRNQGSYYPEVIEDTFDHLVKIDQQQQDQIDRCVSLPNTVDDSEFDPELPSGITDASGKVPLINDDSDGWADIEDWPTASDITGASASAAAAAASAAAAAASAAAASTSAGINSPYGINNTSFAASVAANALTIALKQSDASTDHSTGSASGIILFRSSTETSGAYVSRTITSALSVVVPSGATLGHNDALADYVYIYAIDNAGTVELAVSSSNHWDEGQRVSTTAIGTGSDDAATMYSTSARTNVGCRLIGRILSTQTTAGTWASAITRSEPGFTFKNQGIQASRAANFIPKNNTEYLVSTASARTVTLPTSRAGYRFIIKDSTGSAGTNAISIDPGAVNIDGVAGTLSLNRNYGRYEFVGDGTNWFTLRTDSSATVPDYMYLSFTALANAYQSPQTLSPASTVASYGTTVTRSGDNFTFSRAGVYHISLVANFPRVSGASNTYAFLTLDVYNGSSAIAEQDVAYADPTATNGDATASIRFSFPFTVSNTGLTYTLRMATDGNASVTTSFSSNTTAGSTLGYAHIQYMGS